MSASPELRDCHDCAADELRAAASLMRERAELAEHGPWTVEERPAISGLRYSHAASNMVVNNQGNVADGGFRADAEYIASMHPGVALAVARMLEELAEHAAQGSQGALVADGLDIARAYTELRI